MTLEALALQGRPKTYTTLAASVASRILELRKELIKESLGSSQSPEHQMEFVANIHGIEFINDSHACNINATWFALESLNRPVIWIAGGGRQTKRLCQHPGAGGAKGQSDCANGRLQKYPRSIQWHRNTHYPGSRDGGSR